MDRATEQRIRQALERIEAEQHIQILYAVESGSRAWGFASPDSDYDVRFIYQRPKEYYLQLEKGRDTLEYMLPGDLDMSGWDLDKTLKLLHASNPSLIEWINSPIVYKTTPEFAPIVEAYRACFSPKTGIHHYLSMAKGNYTTFFVGETVRVKKYFYVLRPILAAKHILRTQTPPPVPFDELVKGELEEELHPFVDELISVKKSARELQEIPRVEILDEYMERSLVQIEQALATLEPRKDVPELSHLDTLFCRLIGL